MVKHLELYHLMEVLQTFLQYPVPITEKRGELMNGEHIHHPQSQYPVDVMLLNNTRIERIEIHEQ
jgi:hypothetical protein